MSPVLLLLQFPHRPRVRVETTCGCTVLGRELTGVEGGEDMGEDVGAVVGVPSVAL